MSETVMSPSVGVGVLHLFCKPYATCDPEAVVNAVKSAQAADCQVVCVSMFGHKCDAAFMASSKDMAGIKADANFGMPLQSIKVICKVI